MKFHFEIRYSWIYNVVMNKSYWKYSLKDYKQLQNDCKIFERLFNKHIKKIPSLIEKHAGKGKWAYHYFPVYIVKYRSKLFEKGLSFSDPLTLKYRKDEMRMLLVFIHELVHNYLLGQIERGRKRNEELVWEITNKVWRDLKLGEVPRRS